MRYEQDEIIPVPKLKGYCFICSRYKICNHVIDLTLATPPICNQCFKGVEDYNLRLDWKIEGF